MDWLEEKRQPYYIYKKNGPSTFFLDFNLGFCESSFIDHLVWTGYFTSKLYFISIFVHGLKKEKESLEKNKRERKLLVNQDFNHEKGHF